MKTTDLVERSGLKIFYGHIVVLAAFLIVLVGWGTFFSFGVFFEPVLKEFGWKRAETSGAYSLSTLIIGFMAIVMGRLNDRLGPRIVLTICGFFAGIGYLLISLITAIWQLYLFYAIIVAVGVGGFFVPPTSTVARWFVKKRTFMTGVVLLGASFGVIIIPTIATWLVAKFGWRLGYAVMGVVNLIVIVSTAQLLKSDPKQVGNLPYGIDQKNDDKTNLQTSGVFLGQAIHGKPFWLLCAIFFCFFFVINTVLAHIIMHAIDIGIAPANAGTIMIAFGGGGIAGRILIGMLGDRIGNKQACLICFLLMSADLICLLIVTGLGGLWAFAAIIGFAFSGIGALMGPLTADFFGLRSHGLIFGIIYASDMVGGAIGPVMAGRIFDLTGSYHLAFIFCTVVGSLGSLLVWQLKYDKIYEYTSFVPRRT